jgi:hypothetical protein
MPQILGEQSEGSGRFVRFGCRLRRSHTCAGERALGRNVTFPARQYSVNRERRSFALLRPANGDVSAQEAIRDAILEAYSGQEAAS